jgi:hypothetical protein
MTQHHFDSQGRFVIEDYGAAPPFASFLPGIAGPLGIPLWAFYVNRGQAIAGFGFGTKDGAIMEFLPANKAYQSVPLTGFRTFIKACGPAGPVYEPFSAVARPSPARRMIVDASEIELEEVSAEHGLQVNVAYFGLPGEPFAGLVRQVTVRNTCAEPLELEVLDGLPVVIPYGVNNEHLKQIGRTAEAWMAVYNLESGLPFYRVQASLGDEAEVAKVEAGNFYLPFVEQPSPGQLSAIIVDPTVIFGNDTGFFYPDRFAAHGLAQLSAEHQVTVCRTPCAFAGASATLEPGQSVRLYAILGCVSDLAQIEAARDRLAQVAYVAAKSAEAKRLTTQLTGPIATHTADPRFDGYCRQTLLDNILRGGWPVRLDGRIYHLYGRRHGDLERDYNAFYLPPEFYSQGNAAYRDVNQNRRCDVLLNPVVGNTEVLDLLELIQADGYNPLSVLGSRFVVPRGRQDAILRLVDQPEALRPLLAQPFAPGQLLKVVLDAGMRLSVAPEAFVEAVLTQADQGFAADFGEGYWMDHWYYNLDLIQSYLAVYPDRKEELLFERTVAYYDTPIVVQPRDRKYVLTGAGVRQYDALERDEEHAALIASRPDWPNLVRTRHGRGEIFRSTVFGKLCGLAVIKFATLDPLGMGMEMEAGKPGWCDALNGLPGLFGSAMPATYELLRLLDFLLEAVAGRSGAIALPVEVAELLQGVAEALTAYYNAFDADRDFRYWDTVAAAREAYRDCTRLGFDGRTQAIRVATLAGLLAGFREKVADGIARAEAVGAALTEGLPPTYFTYEAREYAPIAGANGEPITDSRGRPHVQVKRFGQVALPAFLEGPMHALRLKDNLADARKLYARVKASSLYDRKLGMYKTNAPLAACSHEIGRLAAFTPGWLENESVFLHMAYKYLLEVLRAGLAEEFFAEMRCGLVPFLDPAVYGRSTLENSSFIASSAHPDESLHGRGFVARLTGACAEFLSIWTTMMAGLQPFFMRDGELCLRFKPTLPRWLFRDDGTLSFTFLGQCSVTYRMSDDASDEAQVAGVTLHLPDQQPLYLSDDVIPAPYAAMVRGGEIAKIDINVG